MAVSFSPAAQDSGRCSYASDVEEKLMKLANNNSFSRAGLKLRIIPKLKRLAKLYQNFNDFLRECQCKSDARAVYKATRYILSKELLEDEFDYCSLVAEAVNDRSFERYYNLHVYGIRKFGLALNHELNCLSIYLEDWKGIGEADVWRLATVREVTRMYDEGELQKLEGLKD